MDQVARAIKDVLSACINTRGVRVDKLSTFDIEYLFLHIRGKSVGETIEVMATCPDDGTTKVPVSVSIDEINVIEDPEHNKDIKLDATKITRIAQSVMLNPSPSIAQLLPLLLQTVYKSPQYYHLKTLLR